MLGFVICKNEEHNIERCVRSLINAGLRPVLLDSGSTDRTISIAQSLGAQVRSHDYVNHCQTYNRITLAEPTSSTMVVVDADMIVSRDLIDQACAAFEAGADVVQAPVQMVWAGYTLRHASLYPPKPFAFRGGRVYFEPRGHGEQLVVAARKDTVRALLIHDDRKPYASFLASQIRYGAAVRARLQNGDISWKDRLRALTPIVAVAQPFVSLLWKGGVLDGRGGVVYAVDRLIAEAILFREAIADGSRTPSTPDPSPAEDGAPPASQTPSKPA